MLAFVTSARFADHRLPGSLPEAGHPERPDRLRAIHGAVRQAGMVGAGEGLTDLVLHFGIPGGGPPMAVVTPEESAGDETLGLVHPPEYIRFIGDLAHSGGGYADEGETYAGPESDAVARLAVAAALRAADVVMDGSARRSFAAVRPPGHHALADRAMGFCLYANAAIAARHLQRKHGLSRVAIVDFDVHHGNGTQAIFWRDPSVLNVSLHQDPRTLWPGSGFAGETGEDAGRGCTLNVPLPPGTGDERFLTTLNELVLDRVAGFAPEAIVVSAGFDAHASDPLAQLELSSDGFGRIGATLARLAEDVCDGRLIALLEGGYDLRALGQSVTAFLRGLAPPTA